MNNRFYLLILPSLFFLSCEKKPVSSQDISVPDQNLSNEDTSPVDKALALKTVKDNNSLKDSSSKIDKDSVKEPVKSVQPDKIPPNKFSDELLKAVNNWNKVPKSAFPAKPVLSTIPVSLSAKTSSGIVIAQTISSPGSELQAIALNNSILTVANINNSKLQGQVNVDDTDFKELLSYRFELNRQIKKTIPQTKDVEKKQSSVQKQPTATELPDPLDFGHGRFCICKSCREKRLAKQSSSL